MKQRERERERDASWSLIILFFVVFLPFFLFLSARYATDIIVAHRLQDGFPLLETLRFRAVLRVAEGRLRLGSAWVVQEGYR